MRSRGTYSFPATSVGKLTIVNQASVSSQPKLANSSRPKIQLYLNETSLLHSPVFYNCASNGGCRRRCVDDRRILCCSRYRHVESTALEWRRRRDGRRRSRCQLDDSVALGLNARTEVLMNQVSDRLLSSMGSLFCFTTLTPR